MEHNNRKIKGAVFDLDHTLFDRYATLTEIAPYLVEAFGCREGMTLPEVTDAFISADKNYVHLGWQTVFAHLRETVGFRDDAVYEDYNAFLLDQFTKHAVKFSFTIPLLEQLRSDGYKLALITNGSGSVQNAKLGMLDLKDKFDNILISREFGADKPSPEPFLYTADVLGCRPDELIYVGDDPKNDVYGSRSAGYIPVWVMTTGLWVYPDIPKPEYCIQDVREVPELLKKLNGDE